MLQHHPKDILAAGADALSAAFGVPNRNPHPLSDDLITAPLSRLAYAAGLAIRPQQSHESDIVVMGRGMKSRDFSKLLADASTTLANRRFSAMAEHRSFCAEMECRDFKPTEMYSTAVEADGDNELPEVDEYSPISAGSVVLGKGMMARLKTYSRILRASRQLIINDFAEMFSNNVKNLGSAAARTEARCVYSALESNPTLGDGELVFHSDHNNIVIESLSSYALGEGMRALRMMPLISGEQADLTASHLVVAAELEMVANHIVQECGMKLSVTASARLPTGRWYLLPSPETAPVIGVLRLNGSTNRVTIEAWQEDKVDGASVRARCDTGAVLVARTMIRGGE